MAQIPNRSRFGLGVIDGYSSDAEYLAALGSSAKRGDFYYNTESNRYRYYNGSEWADLTTTAYPNVRLIDHTLSSIPTGPQTVDGIATSVGDIVILAGHDNKAYQVDVGAWFEYPLFNSQSTPTESQTAYVKEGSVYAGTYVWYDSSSWRILNLIREAATEGAIPVWDGNRYVADNDLLGNGTSLSTKSNADSDAVKAQSITIQGGNKTAGTGDGGDAYLKGGTSAGGEIGRIKVDALATQFIEQVSLPSIPESGDFVYHDSSMQYWNGSEWKKLTSVEDGTVQYSILNWDGTSKWVENASVLIGSSQIYGPANSVNDAFSPSEISIKGANKTAGTGSGGNIKISGGTSSGSTGGSIGIRGGTGPSGRGLVEINKLEVDTPSLTSDAATLRITDDTNADTIKAANLTVQASNKTAGTGDGGNLLLYAGSSTGGNTGSVTVSGKTVSVGGTSNTYIGSSGGSNTLYGVTYLDISGYKGNINWYIDPDGLTQLAIWGADSNPVGLITNNITTAASGKVKLRSGDVTGAYDSGNIELKTGASSAANRGVISLNGRYIDANSTRIKNLTDPSDPQDAATKAYVDSVGGGGGGGANTALSNLSVTTAINSALLAGTDGTLDLGSSANRWSNLYLGGSIKLGTSLSYAELMPLVSLSISASQTNAVVFSMTAASYNSIFVEYQLTRNSQTVAGTIKIANNGSIVSIVDEAAETASTGVTFSADISSGNVRLLYTSDASGTGSLKYHLKRW